MQIKISFKLSPIVDGLNEISTYICLHGMYFYSLFSVKRFDMLKVNGMTDRLVLICVYAI